MTVTQNCMFYFIPPPWRDSP